MEDMENIILGLVVQLNRCESFESDLVSEVEHRSALQIENDNLKEQVKNLMIPTNAKPVTQK